MTNLYKLLNALEKKDEVTVEKIATENPEVLEKKVANYNYCTPVCIAVDKGMYELAFKLAKINLKATYQSCGGDTTDTALYYLLDKHGEHHYQLILDIAKLDPKLVDVKMLMHYIGEKQFERVVELSKFNPPALEQETFRYSKPIEFVIKSGYTELADQLIGVLDQYNNQSHADDL